MSPGTGFIPSASGAGQQFMLVDTGGIEPQNRRCDPFADADGRRSLPLKSADVIILVTDLKTGVTATDRGCRHDAAQKREAGGAVRQQVRFSLEKSPPDFYEFYNLGLGDPVSLFPPSMVTGTGDLLDAVFEVFATLMRKRNMEEDLYQGSGDRQAQRGKILPDQ